MGGGPFAPHACSGPVHALERVLGLISALRGALFFPSLSLPRLKPKRPTALLSQPAQLSTVQPTKARTTTSDGAYVGLGARLAARRGRPPAPA